MIPRECDNDDCDYETGVRDGVPRAWWVHVPGCQPLESRAPGTPEVIDNRSFLSFMRGYQ